MNFRHHSERQLTEKLLELTGELMASIEALTAAITVNTTVVGEAVAAIQTQKPTQAEIDSLTSTVDANNSALDAVVKPAPAPVVGDVPTEG